MECIHICEHLLDLLEECTYSAEYYIERSSGLDFDDTLLSQRKEKQFEETNESSSDQEESAMEGASSSFLDNFYRKFFGHETYIYVSIYMCML